MDNTPALTDDQIIDIAYSELEALRGGMYQSSDGFHWYGEKPEIIAFARAILAAAPVAQPAASGAVDSQPSPTLPNTWHWVAEQEGVEYVEYHHGYQAPPYAVDVWEPLFTADQMREYAALLAAAPAAQPTDALLDMLGRIHPCALSREENSLEKSVERLRRPYVRQQPLPVPDQAAVVWRADLGRLLADWMHKRAFFDFHTKKQETPIDTILLCPKCGMQHIDAPETEEDYRQYLMLGGIDNQWENPPHRSHLCLPEDGGCGHIWRPADVPTNGVAAIKTQGKNDSPTAAPAAQPVTAQEIVGWMLEWSFNGEETGRRFYDDERHCLLDAEKDGGVCLPLVYARAPSAGETE